GAVGGWRGRGGRGDAAYQPFANGYPHVDPPQPIAETTVAAKEQAVSIRRHEMETRDLMTGDMGQSGEGALQHLVEIERAAHGFVHRAQNLQVPDQGRRLIVSHDLPKGSKSSATGLGVKRWSFRVSVSIRSDTVRLTITLAPSPAPPVDRSMDASRESAPSERGVYARRDSRWPAAPSPR